MLLSSFIELPNAPTLMYANVFPSIVLDHEE